MNYKEESYDFAHAKSLIEAERLINDVRDHLRNCRNAHIGIAPNKAKQDVIKCKYENLFIAKGKLFPLFFWGFVDLVKKVGLTVDTKFQPTFYCGQGFIFVYSSN